MPEWPYKHTVVQFKTGDRLLLYTDGVTEAENGQAEEYGEAQLIRAAKSWRRDS